MLDALWDRILIALDGKVPASTLESWIQPCRLVGFSGDELRVAAPNKSTRDWLTLNHAEALDSAAREVLGGNPHVSIEIDRDAPPPARPLRPHRDGAALEHVTGLAARYTF